MDFLDARHRMVEEQIIARGLSEPVVVQAMLAVPRELFVPESQREEAYADKALPLKMGQTISQPYIVALMVSSLGLENLKGRVLEVGAGSGYAAAVLGQIARDVYAIERHSSLINEAKRRFKELGYENVHLIEGDGTLGYPDQALYDAILVSAGGPDVPPELLKQLKVGGRLIIPVGDHPRAQKLIRVTRMSEVEYNEEDLGGVMFVPLIGEAGWQAPSYRGQRKQSKADDDPPSGAPVRDSRILEEERHVLRAAAETFQDVSSAPLDGFLKRVGDARVVLLGDSSCGTSEFYQMRARMTKELVTRKGFNLVAVEADWPDAERIDAYVRYRDMASPNTWRAFSRFPSWMWRNREFEEFVNWLRRLNSVRHQPQERVAFYGLDLYSLFTSISEVLTYLAEVDPLNARLARQRYSCLSPWARNPPQYGHDVLVGKATSCEDQVVTNLRLVVERSLRAGAFDEALFNALQNARLVKNAERYYRKMYMGSFDSWNIRDSHMFETLQILLDHHGAQSKVVVWEHNSHVGYARATDMWSRGEYNLGQLCREYFGDRVYAVGFGTYKGHVAAASDWEGPVHVMELRPSHPESVERILHESGLSRFILPLNQNRQVQRLLDKPRLERAIGVVYRPEAELVNHYLEARLSSQFDDFVWFDESSAITPLETVSVRESPDTYPFGV